jgi:hypothetical protein
MKKLIYSLVLFGTGFFLFSPHLAFSESFSESVESVYPESINFQLLFYVLEEEASEDIIEGLDVDFAVKNQNCTSVENRFFDKAGNTDLYGHYYTNYNYFLFFKYSSPNDHVKSLFVDKKEGYSFSLFDTLFGKC